jgi:hypothetical protein
VNIDRIKGVDPYPPCPIYLREEREEAFDVSDNNEDAEWQPHSIAGRGEVDINNKNTYSWQPYSTAQFDLNEKMTEQFKDLWGFDPATGEPVNG